MRRRPGELDLQVVKIIANKDVKLSDGDGRIKIVMNGWLELSLHQGDLTEEYADAIVNPTNERLQFGGGITDEIIAKTGP